MLKCKLSESVTFLEDSNKAVGKEILLLCYCLFCLGGLFLALLGSIGFIILGGFFNLHVYGYLLVLDDTEYGISDDLLVCTRNRVVRVVLAVDVARDSVGFTVVQILEAEDRARAVGEEGITGVIVGACTHPGENGDIGELILCLIKSDTVCGKSYCKAEGIESVLESHLKECGSSVVLCVLCELVVVIKLLKGVLRAVCLDSCLYLTKLLCCFSGADIYGHKLSVIFLLRDLELVLHFGKLSVGLYVVGVLQSVVCSNLGVLVEFGACVGVCLDLCGGNACDLGDLGCDYIEDICFKSRLFDKSGNEVLCILTAYGILYTETVFDVLNVDLAVHCRLIEAVEQLFRTVIGKFYDKLRHKLILCRIGVSRVTGSDVDGVGKHYLTRSSVYCSNLSGELICPELVAVFFILKGHLLKLVSLAFKKVGLIKILVYRSFVVDHIGSSAVLVLCVNRVEGSCCLNGEHTCK